nr:universal stress protein [Hymenolepis microstoma]
MGRTVLLPVDPNENCKHALKFYINNFFNKEDTLIFLHVIDQSSKRKVEEDKEEELQDNSIKNPTSYTILDNGKALAHKYLAWGRDAGINVKAFVRSDPKAGEAILTVADELDVDHIIMASRGLNALGRTFMGSVSTYVVHHSSVPVTVVPCPDKDKPTRGFRHFSLY